MDSPPARWRAPAVARLSTSHSLRRLLRLERVDLDLHATVLRVVVRVARVGGPVPATPRSGELVRLERRELPHEGLLHCVRAPKRQLLHVSSGDATRIP